MQAFIKQLTDYSFWIELLNNYRLIGPLAPILLAYIESLIPALPLIVIVSFNVGAHGPIWGFLFSWIGSYLGSVSVFLFFRHIVKKKIDAYTNKKPQIKRLSEFVSTKGYGILFLLTCLPFTPSSLINIVYGLSNVDSKFFIGTISISKIIMIGYLAFVGYSVRQVFENPLWLISAILTMILLYFISKQISKRYLESAAK